MPEISKKDLRGEDGYKITSIRVRNQILEQLDDIAVRTNRSRNEVINFLLADGLKNLTVKEED